MELWRNNGLTLRVSYYLSSQKSGAELADYENLTQLLPSGFGDDMLRFGGIGEIVTWASWTDGDPTDEAMAELEKIIRWAAARRMGFQIHWNPERTVDKLLTILERVNAETPLAPCVGPSIISTTRPTNRSSASRRSASAGCAGFALLQQAQFKKVFGVDVAHARLRRQRALDMGVKVARAPRIVSPTITVRVARLVRTVGRTIVKISTIRRGSTRHAPRFLRACTTMGSAWFAITDDRRGVARTGKFADLAVPSGDYNDGSGERDRRHRVAADDRRRQDRPRRWPLRGARSKPKPVDDALTVHLNPSSRRQPEDDHQARSPMRPAFMCRPSRGRSAQIPRIVAEGRGPSHWSVEELGYRRNAVAAEASSGPGALVGDFSRPDIASTRFPRPFSARIAEVLGESGYAAIVADVGGIARKGKMIDQLIARGVDGSGPFTTVARNDQRVVAYRLRMARWFGQPRRRRRAPARVHRI